MATTRKFTAIVGDIDSDRRARIEALKDEARVSPRRLNTLQLVEQRIHHHQIMITRASRGQPMAVDP